MQNRSEIYIPQGAYTGEPAYAPIENYWASAATVILVISAIAGSQTVTLNIEGFDAASGTWYLILASAAKAVTGTTVLRVNENIAAVANLVSQDVVPKKWRIRPAHFNGGAVSYSVGYNQNLN
jgi:hypothetical protein